MEVVEGVKKGSFSYIYDNYIYRIKWRKNETSYLICTVKSCPGRAVLKQDVFRATKQHNHPHDSQACSMLRFRAELVHSAENSSEPLKKVFYDVAENHQHAATNYTYISAKTRMRRSRKNTHPPNTSDLCTLRNYLESEDWNHLGKAKLNPSQQFFHCLLQVEDGAEVLVFVSPEISPYLNRTKTIHIDGTFQIIPHDLEGHQLTTIHIVYQNKVYAAVYAVMSRRTRASYVTLLRYIKSIHSNMNPEESMSDFEIAERQAISEVFPGILTRGCWFHYAQAIWKKHKQIGMCQLCKTNIRGRKILQILMSLPLLPASKIRDGLSYVQEQINLANLNSGFSELMDYIHSYWMCQVGCDILSVYGCARRTNNDVESFHLQLFHQSGKKPHPSLWDFISILVNMDKEVTLKFLAHKNGGIHSHPKRKSAKLQDQRIKEAEESLLCGAYSIGDFLESVSHSVSNLERSLRFPAASSSEISTDEDESVDNPNAYGGEILN